MYHFSRYLVGLWAQKGNARLFGNRVDQSREGPGAFDGHELILQRRLSVLAGAVRLQYWSCSGLGFRA